MTLQAGTVRYLATIGLVLALLGQVFPIVEAGIDQEGSLETEAAESSRFRVLVRPVVDVHGLVLRAESNHDILAEPGGGGQPPTTPGPSGEGAYVQTHYTGGEPRVLWAAHGDVGATGAVVESAPPDGGDDPAFASWVFLLGSIAIGLALVAGARRASSSPEGEETKLLLWATLALTLGTAAIIASAWAGFDGHPTGLGLGAGFTALATLVWGTGSLVHRLQGTRGERRGKLILSALALAGGLVSLGPWVSGDEGGVVYGAQGDGVLVLVMMLLAPVWWTLRGPGRAPALAGTGLGVASFSILVNAAGGLQKAGHGLDWGLWAGAILVGAFLAVLALLHARRRADNEGNGGPTARDASDPVTFDVLEVDE